MVNFCLLLLCVHVCVCVVESWECTPLRCGEKRVSGSKCHCSSDCLSGGDCCTNYGIVCNGETMTPPAYVIRHIC